MVSRGDLIKEIIQSLIRDIEDNKRKASNMRKAARGVRNACKNEEQACIIEGFADSTESNNKVIGSLIKDLKELLKKEP